jgi:putative transposase
VSDADFSGRWRSIKTLFSKRVPPVEARTQSAALRGERGIWQRRFWEHTIRDDRDFGNHMDYVHFNPVKHGHASLPADWPYSSFKRCVALGIYPADWIGRDTALASHGESV